MVLIDKTKLLESVFEIINSDCSEFTKIANIWDAICKSSDGNFETAKTIADSIGVSNLKAGETALLTVDTEKISLGLALAVQRALQEKIPNVVWIPQGCKCEIVSKETAIEYLESQLKMLTEVQK